jgi:hypothetical protein
VGLERLTRSRSREKKTTFKTLLRVAGSMTAIVRKKSMFKEKLKRQRTRSRRALDEVDVSNVT